MFSKRSHFEDDTAIRTGSSGKNIQQDEQKLQSTEISNSRNFGFVYFTGLFVSRLFQRSFLLRFDRFF